MSKILVTGCAGFIGSNLCKSLVEHGHEVVGLDDLSAGTRENVPGGVDFHRLDVRTPDIEPLFAGVDVAFHLAAKNCLPDCMADPLETVDQNVKATVQVLEAVRRQRVPKIVYADTSAEYEGIDRFPTPVDEVAPVGPYAVSKRAGALFVESYGKLYGQRWTALRYFNVYGPAQDFRRTVPPLMSAFIMRLLQGQRPFIYGDGSKRRDFVYVDDVNRMHLACIDDERTDGRVFNVGSGVNHSVREVFDAVEALLQTGIEPEYRDEQPGEAAVTLADISASREIGWEPEIDLTEGLRRSIDYIRHHVLKEGS